MPDDQRPYRLCEACQQVDNHPRHVTATAPGEGATSAEDADAAIRTAVENGWNITALLSQVKDDQELTLHMDCCAARGCNICSEVLSSVSDAESHGLELAAALSPKDN